MVNIGKNFGKDIPTTLKPMTTVYAPKIEIPVENKAAAKSAPLKSGQGVKLDTSNLKFDPVDRNGDVVPAGGEPQPAKIKGSSVLGLLKDIVVGVLKYINQPDEPVPVPTDKNDPLHPDNRLQWG